MMCPVLVVLAVNRRGVLVIEDTVDKGDGWMWDFDRAKTISLDDLRRKVEHAACYWRWHENAVGWYKEHVGV